MAGKTQRIILEAMRDGYETDGKVAWSYSELYDALMERHGANSVPREAAVRQCVRSLRDSREIATDASHGQNIKSFWVREIADLARERSAPKKEEGVSFLDPFPKARQPLKTAQAIQDRKATEEVETPAPAPAAKPAVKAVTVGENYRKGFQDGWDAAISHLGFTVTHSPVATQRDSES